jgi:serine/threonine protein kinase
MNRPMNGTQGTSGPPSPIGNGDGNASYLTDDMDETISINTTMMTDFNDDVVLEGESIMDSIRKQEASTSSSLISASLMGRSIGPPAVYSGNEPTILSEPTILDTTTIQDESGFGHAPGPTMSSSEVSLVRTEESAILTSSANETSSQLALEVHRQMDGVDPTKRGVSFSLPQQGSLEEKSPEKILADQIKIGQLNAAQTPFSPVPGVISFCAADIATVAAIKSRFPQIEFREEVPSKGDEEMYDPGEFRFCVLSKEYSIKTGQATVASHAAEANRLLIIKTIKTEEGDGTLSEEWESLCLHEEYCYEAYDTAHMQEALDNAEKFILSRMAKEQDEYSAVTQIDEYIVLEELGHGAQGVVYKAQHHDTKEIVAIKELRNMMERISTDAKMEIAVMKRLNHPHLAKLIKIYYKPEDSSSLFLVLEFVPGGSLLSDSEVWNGNFEPFPMERAQAVFQQLVRGVSYLHHMGVLHRDIKPSNVLGNRHEGPVKVSDFGVSSFTKSQKSARVLGEDDIIIAGSCGTPAFLPPEACGGSIDNKYHGRPADIWSLGVTLYVMLFGRLPFKGTDRATTARAICKEELKLSWKLPSPVKELLIKMLDKDPIKRATMVYIIDHPWVKAGSWKADVSERDLQKPVVSSLEADQVLVRASSFKKRARRRSQTLVKYTGAFLSVMSPVFIGVRSAVSRHSFTSETPKPMNPTTSQHGATSARSPNLGSPMMTHTTAASVASSTQEAFEQFGETLREFFCCTEPRTKPDTKVL